MALLKALCWALIFIIRIRFPPGTSLATVFRVMNNKMCTYIHVKNAFSYFYPKRKVLKDGVSTIPLDI